MNKNFKEWEKSPKIEPQKVITTCVTVSMAILEANGREQTMNDLEIMKSYCDKCKHKGTCINICPTVWFAVLQRERSK